MARDVEPYESDIAATVVQLKENHDDPRNANAAVQRQPCRRRTLGGCPSGTAPFLRCTSTPLPCLHPPFSQQQLRRPNPAVEPSPIAAATPRTPQQFCSISNINYYFNSDGKNNNIINQVISAGVLGWVVSWLGFDGCCKSGCYDLVVSIVQSLRRTEWFVLYYVVVRYV